MEYFIREKAKPIKKSAKSIAQAGAESIPEIFRIFER